MRRSIVTLIAGALIAGLAAPAFAEPQRSSYESVSANAFWHKRRVVEPGVVDRITWYIGIYWSTDSVWSDVYKDVVRCRRLDDGRRRCRTIQSIYGDITDLGDGTFTYDQEGLTQAYLEATYPLQARDPRTGEPIGDVKPTRVTTSFVGTGELSSDEGVYTFRNDCMFTREEYAYSSRPATATGSVGALTLTETADAYLNESSYTSFVNNRCEDGGEPEPEPTPTR